MKYLEQLVSEKIDSLRQNFSLKILSRISNSLSDVAPTDFAKRSSRNSMLYDFLRDSKGDKTKRAEMTNNSDKGGLKMIDIQSFKDGAYYCYCAYVLRRSRYSDFLWVVLINTEIFLRGSKLCGESRT